MAEQYKINWKRLSANKIKPKELPTAIRLKDMVRVEDMNSAISGIVTTSGIASSGDLIFGSGGAWAKLPIGPSGNILVVINGLPGWQAPSAGGLGDVVGPSSAVNNAIAVYDSTTGKLIKVSQATITSGNLVIGGNITASGDLIVGGNTTISGDLTILGNIVGLSPGGVGFTVAQDITLDAGFRFADAAISGTVNVLHIIGDTNQAQDITIPSSGLEIIMYNDAQLNMGSSSFVWTNSAGVRIHGNGSIRFSYPTDDILFDANGNTTSKLVVKDIRLVNNSIGVATLASGVNGRISSCLIDGNITLDGTRNAMSLCDINGSLTIASGGIDNMLSNLFVNGAIVDNGSGTLQSDILIY